LVTGCYESTGVDASWLGPLQIIAQHESGGNPKARKPLGLATKNMAHIWIDANDNPTFKSHMMKGFSNILDPISNAIAGINYIKSTLWFSV
jgi:SLT domain-containing protein